MEISELYPKEITVSIVSSSTNAMRKLFRFVVTSDSIMPILIRFGQIVVDLFFVNRVLEYPRGFGRVWVMCVS